jgi:transposase
MARLERAASGQRTLSAVHPKAAGIDVGNSSHWVAVMPDLPGPTVREFGTFTQDLHAIAQWLLACGVTTVALESTGVYWIALFEVLEGYGLEVCLVDTRRLQSVPGRKSDYLDCQWIQQLHTFGLLASAFVPPKQIALMRSYLRQRAMLVSYASHHIQHMHKALQQMNLKLGNVLSDITGQTGLAIVRAIVAGEHDGQKLAEHRDPRCKQDKATIAASLQGHWREDHLFELAQALELYEVYRQKISDCDAKIEKCLSQLPDKNPKEPGQQSPPPLPAKRAKRNRNAPQFDARSQLYRICGVDLTAIDGLDANTVLKVVGEIGTDVSRWPTAKHFCSWLRLCPGTKKSGGKRISSKTRPGANRVALSLRVAAQSLERSPSAMGAFYRRMKARLGGPAAITAAAHRLARVVYALLRYGQTYVDIGKDAYEQQFHQRLLKHLQRQARKLGLNLTDPKMPMQTPA